MNIPPRTLLFLLSTLLIGIDAESKETIYLKQGVVATNHANDNKYFVDNLKIYCYSGKPKYIIYLWQSVSLEVDMDSDNYVYYEGATAEIVEQQHAERRSSWRINLFSSKQKSFKLDPFNHSCIGIDSKELYRIYLNVIRVDYWKVLSLVTGILLFCSANRLSKNVLFYYICGITLGICASFLILIYFLSKLFPSRTMMYGTALCGWTVGVYVLQVLWENTRTILVGYQSYVLWYALITGLVSFIVCYRWGPVTDKRTQNLIQWTLQTVGLFAIFSSSHFQEAAMALVILTLLAYNFPRKWVSKSRTYWKRKFPPKINLLSNTEYYQQGVVETAKALDDLRKYCSSPECNQWKTALKLKDVKRFASFVEGNSHLSDDEILEYETSIQATDLTDDEDMTDEES